LLIVFQLCITRLHCSFHCVSCIPFGIGYPNVCYRFDYDVTNKNKVYVYLRTNNRKKKDNEIYYEIYSYA
jgi:hypothetical protein